MLHVADMSWVWAQVQAAFSFVSAEHIFCDLHGISVARASSSIDKQTSCAEGAIWQPNLGMHVTVIRAVHHVQAARECACAPHLGTCVNMRPCGVQCRAMP